jgi:hypothetical protein
MTTFREGRWVRTNTGSVDEERLFWSRFAGVWLLPPSEVSVLPVETIGTGADPKGLEGRGVDVGLAVKEAAVEGRLLVGVLVESRRDLTWETVRSNRNKSSWKSLASLVALDRSLLESEQLSFDVSSTEFLRSNCGSVPLGLLGDWLASRSSWSEKVTKIERIWENNRVRGNRSHVVEWGPSTYQGWWLMSPNRERQWERQILGSSEIGWNLWGLKVVEPNS